MKIDPSMINNNDKPADVPMPSVFSDLVKKNKESCIECGKPADWVRCTQFAGDHPFCDEHAKQEKGFGTDDSYEYWCTIEQYNEV